MHKLNQKKQVLYNEIDRNKLFLVTAAKEDRSIMDNLFC